MAIPTTGKFAENIYPAVPSDIVGASPIVDGGNFDAEWWGDVDTSDGTRLRISFGGVEVASDPFHFDDVAEELLFRFNAGTILAASSDAARTIRTFTPNTRNTAYGVSDIYGQYNAYDSSWGVYLPLTSDFDDRTSNQNNGTGQGGISAGGGTGLLGTATSFDGNNDYVSVPRDNSIEPSNVSIFAIASVDDLSDNRALVAKSYTSFADPYYSYHIRFASNSRIPSLYVPAAYSGRNELLPTDTYSTSTLYGVATTFDGTFNTQYIDGAFVDSNSQAVTISYHNTPLYIGHNQPTGTQMPFVGDMQHVSVHSTARASAWISEEYAQTNGNATFWGTWTTGTLGGITATPNDLVLSSIVLQQATVSAVIISATADNLLLSSIVLEETAIENIISVIANPLILSSIILESPGASQIVSTSPNDLVLSAIIFEQTTAIQIGVISPDNLLLSSIILEQTGAIQIVPAFPDDLILSAIVLSETTASKVGPAVPNDLVLSAIILQETQESSGIIGPISISMALSKKNISISLAKKDISISLAKKNITMELIT